MVRSNGIKLLSWLARRSLSNDPVWILFLYHMIMHDNHFRRIYLFNMLIRSSVCLFLNIFNHGCYVIVVQLYESLARRGYRKFGSSVHGHYKISNCYNNKNGKSHDKTSFFLSSSFFFCKNFFLELVCCIYHWWRAGFFSQ